MFPWQEQHIDKMLQPANAAVTATAAIRKQQKQQQYRNSSIISYKREQYQLQPTSVVN